MRNVSMSVGYTSGLVRGRFLPPREHKLRIGNRLEVVALEAHNAETGEDLREDVIVAKIDRLRRAIRFNGLWFWCSYSERAAESRVQKVVGKDGKPTVITLSPLVRTLKHQLSRERLRELGLLNGNSPGCVAPPPKAHRHRSKQHPNRRPSFRR